MGQRPSKALAEEPSRKLSPNAKWSVVIPTLVSKDTTCRELHRLFVHIFACIKLKLCSGYHDSLAERGSSSEGNSGQVRYFDLQPCKPYLFNVRFVIGCGGTSDLTTDQACKQWLLMLAPCRIRVVLTAVTTDGM